jgi:hypothetical protein
VKRRFGKYSLRRTTRGDVSVLDFSMRGKSKWDLDGADGNTAVLKLNAKPLWDLNLKMGAGTADLDLSTFKVNKLSIEGGAASFTVKLGAPVQTTTVDVKTGVSEIKFSIPKEVACKINVQSGLSSNDFEGFEKQADGSYETKDYKNSFDKSIVINLKGGLSDFEVNRY